MANRNPPAGERKRAPALDTQPKQESSTTFRTHPKKCSVKTIHVPTPGYTVWATFYNFSGQCHPNPASGWSHLLTGLQDFDALVSGLEAAGLRDKKAAHLALVGHNDAGRDGVVTFDKGGELHPKTGRKLARITPVDSFKRLEPYLHPDAWLSLYICISGAGERGDALLKAISALLPGRTIVGFAVFVVVGLFPNNNPGNAGGTAYGEDGREEPEYTPLTPWGRAAKRARDGKIVHVPWKERKGQYRTVTLPNGHHEDIEVPPYYCSDDCCGHIGKDDDCPGN
jgi:hypothetical protein